MGEIRQQGFRLYGEDYSSNPLRSEGGNLEQRAISVAAPPQPRKAHPEICGRAPQPRVAWPRGLLPACYYSQWCLQPRARVLGTKPSCSVQAPVWSCPEGKHKPQARGTEKGTWKGPPPRPRWRRVQGHITKAGCAVHVVYVLSPGQRRKPTESSCPQQSPVPGPILLFLSHPSHSTLPGQKAAKGRAVSSPREGASLTSLSLFPHLRSEGNETSFL